MATSVIKSQRTGWTRLERDGNNSYAEYIRFGNVVTIYFFHKVSSSVINTWENISFGQLPQDLKPKSASDIVVRCVTDRASSVGCCAVVNQASGNVYISGKYTGATDTSDILQAWVTYIA